MKLIRRLFLAALVALAALGVVADYPPGPYKSAGVIVHDSTPSDALAGVIIHDRS